MSGEATAAVRGALTAQLVLLTAALVQGELVDLDTDEAVLEDPDAIVDRAMQLLDSIQSRVEQLVPERP